MKRVWSLLLVALVTVASLSVSTTAIQSHLQEAKTKEKTLADLLVQQQMQAQLAAAAQQVAKAQEAENLVIAQSEVTLKEPVIEAPESLKAPETPEPPEVSAQAPPPEEQAPLTEDVVAQAPIQTAPTYLEPADLAEIDDVEGYLIAHYFLDGYAYAAAETDPILKADKELACAMESYTIATIDHLAGLTTVMSNLDLSQAQTIHQAMVTGQADFQQAYGHLEGDATFGQIYTAIINYFHQAVTLTELAITLLEQVQSSTNALLALSTLMKAVDAQLMPQVDAVLEAVFTMKELTNAVYLQNTSAIILTKADAKALVQQMEGLFLTW